MNNEQKLLLSLISSFITGQKIKPIKNIDYNELFLEAKRQSVFLIAADSAFNNLVLDKETMVENKKTAFRFLSRNAEVEAHQKRLVKLLEKNDITYMILKGTSSSFYYKKPQFRSLGDVDFLIDPKDKSKVKKLLLDEGFISSNEQHENHIVFKKGTANLEMHFKVSGIPKNEIGKNISDFLNEALYNSVSKNVGSGNFLAPSDTAHGIILLLHTAHHLLNEGLGLRHLLDVGFFVDKFLEKEEFEKVFIKKVKEYKLYEFLKIISLTNHIYFNLNTFEDSFSVDKKICEQLINDILSAGNFGNKDSTYRYSGILITDNKNGVNKSKASAAFATVKQTMYTKYPFLKRFKILYPFMFVYRIIKYFFLMLFGKRKTIASLSTVAEKRKELYKKMQIFE